MGITIKDIAKIAGVSHTTVSRALNDSNLISKDTKDRIKAIAIEHNYVPNHSAKALALNKSFNIGIFFSTLQEGTSPDFFHEVVKGISTSMDSRYNMMLSGIDNIRDMTNINSKNYDGIIVTSQSIGDDRFIDAVKERDIPIVVLGRDIEMDDIVNVLSDDMNGSYNAVKYLIDKGHTRVGIIKGIEGFKSTEERYNGYVKALQKADIDINPSYIEDGRYDIESGYRAMRRMLDLKQEPTAVFSSNDDMAVGAMRALREYNLIPGEDVDIIGFDDSVFSGYTTPRLSTIRRPIKEISIQGTRLLFELIKGNTIENKKVYIKTELITRESS